MNDLKLKPLSKEEIDQNEIPPHDLWIVKIEDKISGPFEGMILKQYAEKEQELFEFAEATRLNTQDWQPFFSHALFQRRTPQIIKTPTPKLNGPYWIINQGLKSGPIEKKELIKRLELGSMTVTDLISIDEGHSWMKIYELPELDRRSFTSQDLPRSPSENQFQEARINILEKLEQLKQFLKTSEEVAGLTYESQPNGAQLIQDVPTKRQVDDVLGPELKLKLAGAFVFILFLLAGVPYFLSLPKTPPAAESVTLEENIQNNEFSGKQEEIMPKKAFNTRRKPASVPKFKREDSETAPVVHTPLYREDLEVHQEEPVHDEVDQHHQEVSENEPAEETNQEDRTPASNESSLVPKNRKGDQLDAEISVDEMAAGSDAQPVVEEASDF